MTTKNNTEEPRLLIWFNIRKNQIQETSIPWMASKEEFLEFPEKSHHYYTVLFYKGLIIITKYTRGSIVKVYEEGEFRCTPPRNKDDTIYVDCNGIRANIYSSI